MLALRVEQNNEVGCVGGVVDAIYTECAGEVK